MEAEAPDAFGGGGTHGPSSVKGFPTRGADDLVKARAEAERVELMEAGFPTRDFEPSLDALSLRSDVISSIKIHSLTRGVDARDLVKARAEAERVELMEAEARTALRFLLACLAVARNLRGRST